MDCQAIRSDDAAKEIGPSDSARLDGISRNTKGPAFLRWAFLTIANVFTAILLPAALWLPLGLVFFVYSFRRKRCPLWALLSIGVVLFCKAVGIGVLFWYIHSMPMKVHSQMDLALSLPPFTFFSVADVGQLEANVRLRYKLVVQDSGVYFYTYGWWPSSSFNQAVDFKTVDPFTGTPYRNDGAIIYSLGPDLFDDHADLIYDPTNGTFSRGDIIQGGSH